LRKHGIREVVAAVALDPIDGSVSLPDTDDSSPRVAMLPRDAVRRSD
jgi:hypothetical protein